MFARVARFEGVDVHQAGRTLAEAEAIVRPLLRSVPGYRGGCQLLTPDGEMLSIAFFDSERYAHEAEHIFDREMPRLLGTRFESWRGRRVSVGRYVVLVDDLQPTVDEFTAVC